MGNYVAIIEGYGYKKQMVTVETDAGLSMKCWLN